VTTPTSSIDAIASAIGAETIDISRHSSPDGAITLLFSDIEGSTEMLERMGDDAWFQFLSDHRTVVRALVETFGGTVIKSQGDGFMVSFPSAHAGLRCAIELQRTFSDHSGPEHRDKLRVRMGLHAGTAIADAEDFYGRNVVMAARIADSAGGGEILISSALKEYTETDPSFEFDSRGRFQLKGLSGEHDVYAVRW
jgi:class 3 adenylate cyclase